MSTQTEFASTDLVFRFVGGKRDGALVPVSTSKCLLGKDKNHEAKCAVYRSSKGTTVKSLVSGVTVNGNEVELAWLREGDQLKVGKSVLRVQQIGFCEGELDEQELPVESGGASLPKLEQPEEEKILSPLTAMSAENQVANAAAAQATPNSTAPPASLPAAAATLPAQPNPQSEVAAEVSTPESASLGISALTGGQSETTGQSETAGETSSDAGSSQSQATESRAASTADTIEALTNRLFDSNEGVQTTAEVTTSALSDQLNALLGGTPEPSAAPSNVEPAALDANPLAHTPQPPTPSETAEPPAAESAADILGRVFDQQNQSATQETPPPSEASEPADAATIPEGSLLSQFKAEPDPEPEPESKEPYQQESVADILARMQEKGEIDNFKGADETPSAAVPVAPSPAPAPAPAPAMPTPAPAAAEGGGESDGSVQDYMNSLFQRLRGGESSPAAPAPSSETSKEADVAESPSPAASMQLPEQEDAPLTEDEFKPRATAPERVVNMDAMRELANAQARNAILLSQSKRRKAITLTCLGIVAFGLGMAGYTFAVADGMDVPFMIGISCLMISCAAGYRCASAFLGWDLETVEHRSYGEGVEENPQSPIPAGGISENLPTAGPTAGDSQQNVG